MQRPKYDKGDKSMLATRAPLAKNFAKLILDTTLPFLKRSPQELTVIDIGCGYGHTAIELAKQCRYVVGIEPMPDLYQFALQLKASSGLTNIEFRQQSVYDLTEVEAYDLVVLDNVFEHLPDQRLALEKICQVLKPKGAVYILTPNKIWPIEPHYHLPFLSYLPLSLANFYLRITGRGEDYSDACYLPTYWGLKKLLQERSEIRWQFVLPSDVTLATKGRSLHYRLGVELIRRFPFLWAISKSFLVVGVKER
jgi:SAM-dependent methyltransferase